MNQVDAFELERISQAITDIRSCMITDVFIPEKIKYCEGQERPEDPEQMEDFYPMDKWGGFDRYGWFRYGFTVPEVMEGKKLWVEIAQDKRMTGMHRIHSFCYTVTAHHCRVWISIMKNVC